MCVQKNKGTDGSDMKTAQQKPSSCGDYLILNMYRGGLIRINKRWKIKKNALLQKILNLCMTADMTRQMIVLTQTVFEV